MGMPHTSPQSVGIDPSAVAAFADALDAKRRGVHGLVIARHGLIAAQGWWHPYRPDVPHMMFSVSKAFTSMAVGLAIDEGVLALDKPTHDIFPEHREVAGQTVRHLLTMTGGHADDSWPVLQALPGRDGVELFFELDAPYPPGEHFVYDTGSSYVLAAAVARRTGTTLTAYLTERLFAPMGWATPLWETDARGRELGGTGLRLTTTQLAEFGQLLLQRGAWGGRQLVPADWVDQASSLQTRNPWFDSRESGIGYGFQLWRSSHGFRADGMYGQFAVVIPELSLVVATTSGSPDANAILEEAWRTLLPGVDPGAAGPAAPDGELLALDDRRVPDPHVEQTDDPAWAGLDGRSFAPQFTRLGIERLTVRLGEGTVVVDLEGAGFPAERLVAGTAGWVRGETRLRQGEPTTACAAWAGWSKGALEIHQQLIETPLRRVWRLTPDSPEGPTLRIGMRPDAGLAQREDVTLTPLGEI